MSSKLSSLLVQEGRVPARRMADAFQRQVIFGGSLDTILLEMGLLDAPVLADALGRAHGMPFTEELPDEGPGTEPAAEVQRGFGALVAERFQAVPLGRRNNKLRVLVKDEPEPQDLADLAETLATEIEPAVTFEYRFHDAIRRVYGTAVPARYTKLATKLGRPAASAGPAASSTAEPGKPSLFANRKSSQANMKPVAAPTAAERFAASLAPASSAKSGAGPAAPSTASAPAAKPEPVAAKPTPVAAKPEPVAVKPQPAVTKPEPVVAKPQLAAAKAEPVAAKPQPAAVKAEPVAAKPTPVAAKPTPVATKPTPVAAKPQPAVPSFLQPPVAAKKPPAAAERLAAAFSSGLSAPSRAEAPPSEPARVDPSLVEPAPAAAAAPFDRRTTIPYAAPISPDVEAQSDAAWTSAEPTAAAPSLSRPSSVDSLGGYDPYDSFRRAAPEIAPPASAAPVGPSRFEESGPVETAPKGPAVATLSLVEAHSVLASAATRDAVFETLCRVARGRFAFAALFTVQGNSAPARMALGPAFFDASALDGAQVSLDAPSPLRTAVQTQSPLIGLADGDPLARTLELLGRTVPAPVAVLPITLRDRVVAVLVADNDGHPVEGDDLTEIVQAAAGARGAFLRIIQQQKKAAPSPAAPVEPTPAATAAAGSEPAAYAGPPPTQDELSDLIGIVENGGNDAAIAAARLVQAGETAAWMIASYFPGPLRFGHRKLHTLGLPLSDHGPLIDLAARFGERIVAPLLSLLEDPAPDVRFHVALVLGEVRSEQSVGALGERLFDADAAVRRCAAAALSRFAPSLPLAALLEKLRDDVLCGDLARERAATAALGELRDIPSVPRLIDLLKHRDMEVVDLAHRALLVITKQDLGTTRWRWRTWWEKARNQSRIEWLLGGLEQPSAEAQRSAAEELQAITTDRFGCHERLGRREREETARKFAAWYRQHPGVFGDERR